MRGRGRSLYSRNRKKGIPPMPRLNPHAITLAIVLAMTALVAFFVRYPFMIGVLALFLIACAAYTGIYHFVKDKQEGKR